MGEQISWRDVALTSVKTGTPMAVGRTSRERVQMMAEYRRSGEIAGAFLATPEELDAADEDEIADLGPSREQIDWTGLDEVLAQ